MYTTNVNEQRGYGKCAVKDGLRPVLKKVNEADVIILGSPIYFGTVTGEMRSFMERLFFPLMTYTDPPGPLIPKGSDSLHLFTGSDEKDGERARF